MGVYFLMSFRGHFVDTFLDNVLVKPHKYVVNKSIKFPFVTMKKAFKTLCFKDFFLARSDKT